MPLYMTQFTYTTEAWNALSQNPEDRREAIGGLLENMGGRLLSFYYSFGEYDGVFTWEAPDEGTAAATILAALSPGHVKAIKTTSLLSVEDAMGAMRKAGEQTYRRPGQQ
jgi:uncharacterized protein with GYD domain